MDTSAAAISLAETHPSEFTLQYPPRREYFQERYRAHPDWRALTARCGGELLLYVHVPFCRTKCAYCNFAVDVRSNPTVHSGYVDHLVAQLGNLREWAEGHVLRGIDIGGGTPTALDAGQLTRILGALRPWLEHTTGPCRYRLRPAPRLPPCTLSAWRR